MIYLKLVCSLIIIGIRAKSTEEETENSHKHVVEWPIYVSYHPYRVKTLRFTFTDRYE